MVLLTGGAGYIGSNVNKLLNQMGYETVVLDNLEYGHLELVKWGHFINGDLKNKNDIESVFQSYQIDAVVHFAAYAYVGESVLHPEQYYRNNVCNTLNLLEVMKEYNCNKIVFSSTCATYGEPEQIPITENMPQNPINPYGRTKLIVENILRDYGKAYGLSFVVLRYFNAAGADPDCETGEWHIPETHIIPLLLNAAAGKNKAVEVYGSDYNTRDGSCVRDYIHVYDLATAHLKALQYLNQGGESDFFNLGNTEGTTVFEIIDAVKRITGRSFQVNISDRRSGDPAILVGSSEKAKKVLKWEPKYPDIETIIKHAWAWYNRLADMGESE